MKEWESRNKEKQRQYRETWNKKHPNYMKEWESRNKEKQRQYRETWNKKHPNYMKEWGGNRKGINAGLNEGVDLAVVLESDKNIYREIDETMKKEVANRRDEW
jgi:hypothetical protein